MQSIQSLVVVKAEASIVQRLTTGSPELLSADIIVLSFWVLTLYHPTRAAFSSGIRRRLTSWKPPRDSAPTKQLVLVLLLPACPVTDREQLNRCNQPPYLLLLFHTPSLVGAPATQNLLSQTESTMKHSQHNKNKQQTLTDSAKGSIRTNAKEVQGTTPQNTHLERRHHRPLLWGAMMHAS